MVMSAVVPIFRQYRL